MLQMPSSISHACDVNGWMIMGCGGAPFAVRSMGRSGGSWRDSRGRHWGATKQSVTVLPPNGVCNDTQCVVI